jgi:hypothetical protein
MMARFAAARKKISLPPRRTDIAVRPNRCANSQSLAVPSSASISAVHRRTRVPLQLPLPYPLPHVGGVPHARLRLAHLLDNRPRSLLATLGGADLRAAFGRVRRRAERGKLGSLGSPAEGTRHGAQKRPPSAWGALGGSWRVYNIYRLAGRETCGKIVCRPLHRAVPSIIHPRSAPLADRRHGERLPHPPPVVAAHEQLDRRGLSRRCYRRRARCRPTRRTVPGCRRSALRASSRANRRSRRPIKQMAKARSPLDARRAPCENCDRRSGLSSWRRKKK